MQAKLLKCLLGESKCAVPSSNLMAKQAGRQALEASVIACHKSQQYTVAVQVEFPAAPPGEEAAWKVLKHIVRACLRVDPRRASPAARMPACQAQEELFAFMQQQKWSDDVSATDAQVV